MPNRSGTIIELLERIAAAVESDAPEGLDAEGAARFIGVSVSKFHQLVADGHAPSSVEIGTGRCPRWMRTELLAWLRAGAPVRSTWVRMKDTYMRRAG